jgi:hypothetical protein
MPATQQICAPCLVGDPAWQQIVCWDMNVSNPVVSVAHTPEKNSLAMRKLHSQDVTQQGPLRSCGACPSSSPQPLPLQRHACARPSSSLYAPLKAPHCSPVSVDVDDAVGCERAGCAGSTGCTSGTLPECTTTGQLSGCVLMAVASCRSGGDLQATVLGVLDLCHRARG